MNAWSHRRWTRWLPEYRLGHLDARRQTAVAAHLERCAACRADLAQQTALAAVLTYPELFRGKRVALSVTGGNIDSRILANTLLRSLLRDGRLLCLKMEIPDRPGVLADISRKISDEGGNIIEVSHQRLFTTPSVQAAELEVMIEARDPEHARALEAELAKTYIVRRA